MVPSCKLGAMGTLLVLSLAGVSGPAGAVVAPDPQETTESARQEDSAQKTDEQEEPVDRIERSIVVTAAEPGFDELATESEIPVRSLDERGVVDLAEGLRDELALSASRRGPVNLDPSVRGLQEGQVAVLVDGTRTFAAGPGRMDSDLAHVSPHAIQTLWVVKGPYALTWGAGALSAIRAETFRPPFLADGEERGEGDRGLAWGGEVRGSWSENGSVADGAATVYGSGERTRFSLIVGSRSGDDYEAGDGTEVPADYRSTNVRWSLGHRLSRRTTLELSGGYQEQLDIDYPGRILDASYFYTRSHALDLDWHPDDGDRGALREVHGQVYVNRKDHRMNNDAKPTALPNPNRMPPFGLDVDLPAESNVTGGAVHAVLDGAGLEWKLGADAYDVRQDARRSISRRDTGMVVFQDVIWPDAEIVDAGVYVQAIRRGVRARGGPRKALEIAGTVRTDFVDASAGRPSDYFLSNTTGDVDQTETNVSAALSGRYRVSDRWVLTGGLGRAVRTASATERYSDRLPSTRFQVAAEFVGDPGLDPEASHEVDVGMELRLGGTPARPGAATLLSVDLFYRVIDSYITVSQDPTLTPRLPLSPRTVYRYVNGDEATFWGGEAELRGLVALERSGTLAWRLGVGSVRGRDETFDEPAFGVPPLTGEVGLRWTSLADRGWLDLAVRATDDQDRVATSRLERPTDGFTRVDLWGGWKVPVPGGGGGDLELRGGVQNLFDEAYADHLSSLNPFTGERIPEPGRRVSVAFVARF